MRRAASVSVGYVKKNLLNGAQFIDFSAVNPAAQVWLNDIANVRIHSEQTGAPSICLPGARAAANSQRQPL